VTKLFLFLKKKCLGSEQSARKRFNQGDEERIDLSKRKHQGCRERDLQGMEKKRSGAPCAGEGVCETQRFLKKEKAKGNRERRKVHLSRRGNIS